MIDDSILKKRLQLTRAIIALDEHKVRDLCKDEDISSVVKHQGYLIARLAAKTGDIPIFSCIMEVPGVMVNITYNNCVILQEAVISKKIHIVNLLLRFSSVKKFFLSEENFHLFTKPILKLKSREKYLLIIAYIAERSDKYKKTRLAASCGAFDVLR